MLTIIYKLFFLHPMVSNKSPTTPKIFKNLFLILFKSYTQKTPNPIEFINLITYNSGFNEKTPSKQFYN